MSTPPRTIHTKPFGDRNCVDTARCAPWQIFSFVFQQVIVFGLRPIDKHTDSLPQLLPIGNHKEHLLKIVGQKNGNMTIGNNWNIYQLFQTHFSQVTI